MPWIKSCLCQQEKKKAPAISPPIHLLLKNEGSFAHGPNHAFRCKVFKKPRPCHLCHQPILNEGSCCRVCKYVCHKVCESKEAAERFADTSWQIHRQWSSKKSPPVAVNNNNNVTTITNGSGAAAAVTAAHARAKPKTATVGNKLITIETVQTTIAPSSKKTSHESGYGTLNRIDRTDGGDGGGGRTLSRQNSHQQHHRREDQVKNDAATTDDEIVVKTETPSNDGVNHSHVIEYRIEAVDGGGDGGHRRRSANVNCAKKNESDRQTDAALNVSQTVAASSSRRERKLERVSHNHDDHLRNGIGMSKMITSSSYSGGGSVYEEALTSQPRSSRTRHPTSSSAMATAVPLNSMDLRYVTERIIALWFPSATSRHAYKEGHRQAAHMLNDKHGDKYMLFNLSEPRRPLRRDHRHVKEVGWSSQLAPPLEKICSVCKDIDSWLGEDQHHIAVLHARGNKDKLGVVVAAYMHYSNICGTAEQALDRFSMRKYLEDNVGPIQLPSNKRYVDYFAGLLSHHIKINAEPLYLTHVTVVGTPSFHRGGCRAFLKLYEGQTHVYTSGIYNVSNTVKQFTVNVAGERRLGLQLRGDILIKCYHHNEIGRETIFACQFHTCAVADYTMSFTKQELDRACVDSRFPLDGAVELHFSPGPDCRVPAPAPTPAVPVMITDDPVVRADSPIGLGEETVGDDEEEEDDAAVSDEEDQDSGSDDVNHTFGPLDGSIYATIAKKSELSPGAVSSPLTVSMDSGISSAGHQQNANTNASASPPLTTAQPSPLTPDSNNHHHHHHHQQQQQQQQLHHHHRQQEREEEEKQRQHLQQQRILDELVLDMMMTVQSIPDLKSHATTDTGNSSNSDQQQEAKNFTIHDENVRYIDDVVDNNNGDDDDDADNIPYHARQDSRPFTYGTMIGEPKGLSSPSLVRKASFNRSSGDTLKKVQTQVFPDYNAPRSSDPPASAPLYRDPIDDIFTANALTRSNIVDERPYTRDFREEFYKEEVKRYDPASMKRSYTDGTLTTTTRRRSPEKSTVVDAVGPYSDAESLSPPREFRNNNSGGGGVGSPEFHEPYAQQQQNGSGGGNLTWLQRQQQKLRERKETQLRESRMTYENRLMTELRTVQSGGATGGGVGGRYNHHHHHHARPTASHRLDGYTSDTTAFADDDDDFTIPLHINTRNVNNNNSVASPVSPPPNRTSSRNYMSTAYGTSGGARERPFVAVKRAHEEKYAQVDAVAGGTETAKRETVVESASGGSSSGLLSLAEPNNDYQQQQYNTSVENAYREENYATWRDGSPPTNGTSPRPQTPAFPVARTPYVNPPTPTVQFDLPNERLPPKSPTTQRRLSYPAGSSTSSSSTTTTATSSARGATKRSDDVSAQERKDDNRPTSPSGSNGSAIDYYGASNQQQTIHHHHQQQQQHQQANASSSSNNYYRDGGETYQHSPRSPMNNGSSSPTVYFGSRRSSVHSNSEPPHEVSPVHVEFVRDTSKYWYKPAISREDAINMLRNREPGTFVVRDSNSFPGAFGLALRVATVPVGVQAKSAIVGNASAGGGAVDELIRHFLIEPTSRGVRLRGCPNEPVFSSLSALVYQHSITPIALPCRLLIPKADLAAATAVAHDGNANASQLLRTQGAACNVLYLGAYEMESLTGPQAVRKAVAELLQKSAPPTPITVHFKVNGQGITLTDNKRQSFFRKHYPIHAVSHCGIDPDERVWKVPNEGDNVAVQNTNRIFGFVARKPASSADNQCHLFVELEPEQPASAITNFVNRILSSSGVKPNIV